MKKVTFVLILLLITGTAAIAQKHRNNLPYAFGHTLDLNAGPTFRFASDLGGPAYNRFHHDIRYSYFPGRHWGGFAEMSLNTATSKGIGIAKKIDGNSYDSYSPISRYTADNITSESNFFLIGGIYRYDFGRWSLRPRAGIGLVSSLGVNNLNYQRHKGNKVEHVYFLYDDTIDSDYYHNLGFSGGIQINFSVGDHFFFSADVNANVNPSYNMQERKIYDTVQKAASSWIEAVTYPQYIDVELISEEKIKIRPGSFISANIGLGWYIGRNRNDRKK